MDSTFFNNYIKKNLSDKPDNPDKICHITFEPLKKDYIVLDCSHTFNYDAIFKEICVQKTVINNKETQKLKKYCIKCPYCRFVQIGILPYRKPYNLIFMVNAPKSKAFTMKKFKCNYVFASGKKKGNCCNKYSEIKLCQQHHKIIEKRKLKKKCIFKPSISIAIEPVIEPVNEIILSSQNNITSNFLDNWQDIWEKKNTRHPILNNNTFVSGCSHVFKKGKSKGFNCHKFVKTTSKNNSPIYYKNVYCKNHSKLKYNKDTDIVKSYYVPLYKNNLPKCEINNLYKDYIDSNEYNFVENKGFYYKKECCMANI